MSTETLRDLNERLQKKYAEIEAAEQRWEDLHNTDAEVTVVAYGITSRVAETAIQELRAEGKKVGMLRPQSLFPFPKTRLNELCSTTKVFLVAEMSNGQMVDDVKLAIEHRRPVEFYGVVGGSVPSIEELKNAINKAFQRI